MEKLLCRTDALNAELVSGLLKEQGIPYFVKNPGPGTVYLSPLIFDVKIYVPEEAYDKAKELVAVYLPTDDETVEVLEEE